MKIKIYLPALLLFITSGLSAQVALSPLNPTSEDNVSLIFDGAGTPLVGETIIYAHAGVVIKNTTTPTGSDWTNVKGNWGKDDGIGKMTAIAGQAGKWKLELSPTLRAYFGVPEGTTIYWLALVFRNANGSKQTSPDIYIKLTLSNSVSILNPSPSETDQHIFSSLQIPVTVGPARIHMWVLCSVQS